MQEIESNTGRLDTPVSLLSARATFCRRTLPYAVGTASFVLLLFVYYAYTWQGFVATFDMCVQPFCDFVDYFYPMGEAIFRTGLPVKGFLYSPFIAILLAVFPLMGLNASLVCWGILQGLSVILCLLLFRRLVPARLPIQLLFVALTLFSFPILLNFVGGGVTVFTMAALLGLLVLHERGHLVPAAVLFTVAVSFKFFPLIFLAAFAALRDSRFLFFAVVACVVLLLLVPGVLLGVGNTFGFYGALVDSFRESDWVAANPHSQFFPHLFLRLVNATGNNAHSYFPLLHLIAYGVAALNIGLLFLIQRARLRHANLWSFQILFLTIPFVLKTSWPHDFSFLPFAQALLAWRLLGEKEPDTTIHIKEKSPLSRTWRSRTPSARTAVAVFLLLTSIILSSIVFFNLFDDFVGYGFVGFLFWADLFLLIASYMDLLPHALRQFRMTDVVYGRHALVNRPPFPSTLKRISIMPQAFRVMLGTFCLSFFALCHGQEKPRLQSGFPVLKGPYLGQKPPGRTAEQFAVNVFDSTYQGFHSNIVFSPDGKEAYWQLNNDHGSRFQAIFESRYENGVWTKPQAASFSTLVEGGLDDAPFISPDGKKLFFLSYRPIEKGGELGKCNIWVMDRTEEGWSKPKPLPSIVNSLNGIHWMLSVDAHGNLYFGTWKPQENGKTTGDIYCSKYEDGQYTRPEKLGPEINVPGYNYCPFISPDGSYLIYSRREPLKPIRLFICFRKRGGEWTRPHDLSNIIGLDSISTDILQGDCPLVTVDGKYLFFRDDLNGSLRPFWIEAGFIEELRRTFLHER